MTQFGIRKILEKHKIIPVVTIKDINDIPDIVANLLAKDIHCIEVTLRTNVAFDALSLLKTKYNDTLDVGVGTVINEEQLKKVEDMGVDFIVSPGLLNYMTEALNKTKIPFINGVVTPSEIMQGLALGYDTFKLFPAEIVGGVKLLKTYSGLFPNVKFCPTGGIKQVNHEEYLALPNVLCVGGSWVLK